jgi:uncharacterized protein (TIGR02646 family)
MRRILRKGLEKRVMRYLSRKQQEVATKSDIQRIWKYARNTKTLKAVFDCLVEMSGKRARCMFCEDSRGTTIEHFWPKSVYREKCFLWDNMLLLCQGCQTHKGDRFDLNAAGEPLLVNPTEEDPWDFLFFEAGTGLLTARFQTDIDAPNLKGAHTTDSEVLPLNIESVTEGRLRTKRNLQRAVNIFLRDISNGISAPEANSNLLQAIRDNDNYGLVIWYFVRDGCSESPFDLLKRDHSNLWSEIQDSHTIRTSHSTRR